MAAEITLFVGVNEDLEFSARWVQDDLTPYIPAGAYCQVRKEEGDDQDNPAVITASVGNNITIDPVEGWATVLVPYTELLAIEPGMYKFDLLLVRQDGRTLRPVKGQINLDNGVTFIP